MSVLYPPIARTKEEEPMLSFIVAQTATTSSVNNLHFYVVAAFAILTLASLLFLRRVTINFMVLYGLLGVAFVATLVVFAEIGETAVTSLFTLLGAIAGYLAGVRTPSKGIDDGSGGQNPANNG
jgi:hypothetical protein